MIRLAKQLPKTAQFILAAGAIAFMQIIAPVCAADEVKALRGVPESARWAMGIDLARVLEFMPMEPVDHQRLEKICEAFESKTGNMLGKKISPKDFRSLVVFSDVEPIKSPSAMILETSFDVEETLRTLRETLIQSTHLTAKLLPDPEEDTAIGPFQLFKFRNEVVAARISVGMGAVARHSDQLTAIYKRLSDPERKKHPLIASDEDQSLASKYLIAWMVHDNVNAMHGSENNQDRNNAKQFRLFLTISAPESGEPHWQGTLKLISSHTGDPSFTSEANNNLPATIRFHELDIGQIQPAPGQSQPNDRKILNLIRLIAKDGLNIQLDNGVLTANFSVSRAVLEEFRDSLFDHFEAQFTNK